MTLQILKFLNLLRTRRNIKINKYLERETLFFPQIKKVTDYTLWALQMTKKFSCRDSLNATLIKYEFNYMYFYIICIFICIIICILSLFSEHLWMALNTSECTEVNIISIKSIETGPYKTELLILMKYNFEINFIFS